MPLDGLQERHVALEDRINAALPDSLKVGAGVLYLHTEGGGPRLDRLSASRLWDRWHDAAVALTVAIQVGGLALVTLAAWIAFEQEQATALNDPVNVVAIPGLNEFMPLVAAPYVVAGLVLATLVHEAGHAIACRRADVPVREYGVALLFGVVPMAAYVLPGEALDDAARRDRLRVFAAGVANNVVLAAVAGALLLLPFTVSAGEAYLTYFGWAFTGEAPPTAGAIAGLGVVGNLSFWTLLLSANFGILNALPVAILDGGRVLSLSLASAGERLGRPVSTRARTLTVHATGVVAVVVGTFAVVGPHLQL